MLNKNGIHRRVVKITADQKEHKGSSYAKKHPDDSQDIGKYCVG